MKSKLVAFAVCAVLVFSGEAAATDGSIFRCQELVDEVPRILDSSCSRFDGPPFSDPEKTATCKSAYIQSADELINWCNDNIQTCDYNRRARIEAGRAVIPANVFWEIGRWSPTFGGAEWKARCLNKEPATDGRQAQRPEQASQPLNSAAAPLAAGRSSRRSLQAGQPLSSAAARLRAAKLRAAVEARKRVAQPVNETPAAAAPLTARQSSQRSLQAGQPFRSTVERRRAAAAYPSPTPDATESERASVSPSTPARRAESGSVPIGSGERVSALASTPGGSAADTLVTVVEIVIQGYVAIQLARMINDPESYERISPELYKLLEKMFSNLSGTDLSNAGNANISLGALTPAELGQLSGLLADDQVLPEPTRAALSDALRSSSTQSVALNPLGPNWIIAENQPCQVYNSHPEPGETIAWSGECVDGKASGRSRLVWRSSHGEDVYEGEYRDGKRHGRGTYTWFDGVRYEGEWRDGQPNGRGTATFPSDDDGSRRYEGQWRNGCFEQDGSQAWAFTTEEACGFE